MPTIALDVVVVTATTTSDHENAWNSTDFYIKFAEFRPNKSAVAELFACIQRYDVIAFNDIDRDAAVKEAASAKSDVAASHKLSEKLKFSIPKSLSSRIEWVDIYCGEERCKDVVALLSCDLHSPVVDAGHVLFFNKQEAIFSLSPRSDTLRDAFNLQPGRNQMKAVIRAYPRKALYFDIYVYSARDKLVVMDVDGTITVSDVRGYVESVYLGRYTYVHDGVVPFLQILRESMNYQVMYLTSRPIAHAAETRLLLQNIRDGVEGSGEVLVMPPGPLFLNRESKARAAYRELVSKSVAAFKSEVLLKIKSLFAAAGVAQPFFIGIGNRPTDMQAYSNVGIPLNAMLMINTYSHVSAQSDTGKEPQVGDSRPSSGTWKEVVPAPRVYNTYRDPALIAYLEDLSTASTT